MIRALGRSHDHLIAVARGMGFDDKLERREGERTFALKVFEGSDGDALTVLKLSVRVAMSGAPTLGIAPLTTGRALAALLGFTRLIPLEDPELERIAVLETQERLRARAALKAGLAPTALELLREFPDAALVTTPDSLVLEIEARGGALERLLELARRAAAAIDASLIRPVSRDAPARCGFCHGDLTPDEKDVRCDRCKATVHEVCWRDHGRCPALGCTGAAR